MKIEIASSLFQRMKGLLGKMSLPRGNAMLITRCNAIHTIGMKFPIDAIFIDKKNKIVKIVRNVSPNKFFIWGTFSASAVIESSPNDPETQSLKIGEIFPL